MSKTGLERFIAESKEADIAKITRNIDESGSDRLKELEEKGNRISLSEKKELDKLKDEAEKKKEASKKEAKVNESRTELTMEQYIAESKVDNADEFKKYANSVLKKAFGEKFDQERANKTINGLIEKYGKDGEWGDAIGALTSGLDEGYTPTMGDWVEKQMDNSTSREGYVVGVSKDGKRIRLSDEEGNSPNKFMIAKGFNKNPKKSKKVKGFKPVIAIIVESMGVDIDESKNDEIYTIVDTKTGKHYDTEDEKFYGDDMERSTDTKKYLTMLMKNDPEKFKGYKIVSDVDDCYDNDMDEGSNSMVSVGISWTYDEPVPKGLKDEFKKTKLKATYDKEDYGIEITLKGKYGVISKLMDKVNVKYFEGELGDIDDHIFED